MTMTINRRCEDFSPKQSYLDVAAKRSDLTMV